MYEITVEREFCAAHALSVAGQREPLHGHNFRVTATIAGEELDHDGLLCDFHTVNAVLKEICRPFVNANLNDVEPFIGLNPTAEQIARHIADQLTASLDESLAPAARVASVRVSETTGCTAIYRR
ncbi:MAG: 6-carboxytetrahydropterin synthase [Phycisphaeraceae bacterium]|nr:MAG: 6-carboxytetrahydropterin synthase [Phycisphaeraceae bacterium]